MTLYKDFNFKILSLSLVQVAFSAPWKDQASRKLALSPPPMAPSEFSIIPRLQANTKCISSLMEFLCLEAHTKSL